MSAESNKSTNRAFYEQVLNRRNLDEVEKYAAADYAGHSFPPGLPPGSAGLKMFLGMFFQGFPDGKVTIHDMVAEGDLVATRLTFSGTHRGNFMNIPASGRQIAIPAIDYTRFAGGKIVEHWGGPDQMSLMIQLGVIPPPG